MSGPTEIQRRQTPESTDRVRLDQEPITPAYPTRRSQMLLPRNHQAGEIEGILMRRRIGTVVVAEFTVIALINSTHRRPDGGQRA